MLLLMPMGGNRVQGPHAGHTQAFGRPPGTSPAPTGRFERVSVHIKTPLYITNMGAKIGKENRFF